MFDGERIALVGQVSDVIMYVALTAGLLIFVIGYFAGAKSSMTKIFICTLIATAVGTLSLRVPIALHDFVTGKKSVQEQLTSKSATPPPAVKEAESSNSGTGEGVLNLFLYIVWTGFLVGMGIFLYEAMTVTASEARPD
jgi:hypothetical protein